MLLSLCVVFQLFSVQSVQSVQSFYAKLEKGINTLLASVLKAREGFRLGYKDSLSNIDTEIQLKNIKDLLNYLPRAIQIGFLSPFPSGWIIQGKTVGLVGRLISGVITIINYTLFIATFYCLWVEKESFKLLLLGFSLAIVMMIMLGMVVTNTGAVFRMRTGFLLSGQT